MARTRHVEHFLAGGTVLAGGLLLLAFGGAQPVLGARVHVPPGPFTHTLRAVALAHEQGLETPVADTEVTITQAGRVLGTGRSDASGVVEIALGSDIPEVALGKNLALPAEVEVAVGRSRATVDLQRAGTVTPAPETTSFTAEGELRIAATLERGALVSPFDAPLVVIVQHQDGSPVDADVQVALVGGAPPKTDVRTTSGTARVVVRADEPTLGVEITASDARGRGAKLRGGIRARMGACVLEQVAGALEVVCPGAQRNVFYSVYARDDRLRGGVVSLAQDARGFFRAGLPPEVADGADTIVLASDATESGASTIAWPLPGHAAPRSVPRLGPAGESLSAGLAHDGARRLQVRVASSFVLALGLAATLLLALRHRPPPVTDAAVEDNAPGPMPIPRAREDASARLRMAALAMILIAVGVAVAILLGAH